MEKSNCYSLEEMIEMLTSIYNNGSGSFNLPKAIFSLAIEIEDIKKQLKGK